MTNCIFKTFPEVTYRPPSRIQVNCPCTYLARPTGEPPEGQAPHSQMLNDKPSSIHSALTPLPRSWSFADILCPIKSGIYYDYWDLLLQSAAIQKQGHTTVTRQPHTLFSICVHSFGALAFIASLHNQPMYPKCDLLTFSSTSNRLAKI